MATLFKLFRFRAVALIWINEGDARFAEHRGRLLVPRRLSAPTIRSV